MLSPRPSNVGLRPGSRLENLGTQLHKIKEVANQKKAPERPCTTNEAGQNHNASANNSGAPAAKYVLGISVFLSVSKSLEDSI